MGDVVKKPLISVIVPIYKVEKYLQKCIDSILNQTYENLEIILVDDGSPDNCPKICDENANRDSRIRVIHKQNGGLSDARNAGLEVFRGEYLMFVDSDDMLPVNSIEILYSLIEKYDAQLAIGEHVRVYDDEILQRQLTEVETKEQVWNPTQAVTDVFVNGCAAWARLYRRDIHDKIRFPINEINEDEAIALQVIAQCKKIVKTEKVVYYYTCRPMSITTSTFSKEKLAWPKHCEANVIWVEKYMPEVKSDALLRLLKSYLWAMREMALADKRFENEILYVKNGIKTHYKNFKRLNLSTQEKIRLMLNRYFPYLIYRTMEKKMAHNNSKKDVEGGDD